MLNFIRSGDTLGAIIFILSGCFVVFICSPVHELSHAFIAYKLGDRTAKREGRLTFNPIKHIDPIGMIMILLFGIGYAKPVPVDMRHFKNPKRDMALVAFAGPVSNILMAFVSCFALYATAYFGGDNKVTYLFLLFFTFSMYINITLGVFNLLPIPPLDGSKILAAVLPNKVYYKYMMYERYVMIALMLLLFTGALSGVIGGLSKIMVQLISIIPKAVFGDIV
ncbi:MAG: site-2 protease family protein [Ruminococcaceae bacterium]|nr:site-2 protease family protein [Oscillospiraceae bacterium]